MKPERSRRLGAGCPALVVVLVLAGCTGGAAGNTAPPVPSPSESFATSGGTPAPPPATPRVTPGSIEQTVEPKPQKTAKPVDLDKPQRDGDIEVELASIKSRKVDAIGPGEIGGSALVVTVRIHNGTVNDLETDGTFVTLIDAKGNAGIGLTNAPSRPFLEPILPGKSATGVYVFRVPAGARSKVRVVVTYSTEHETAVFVGDPR